MTEEDSFISTILRGIQLIRSGSFNNCAIGDTTELVDLFLPILKANDVDFYINGHDHCLQRISSTESPLQFLTSGAGSKAWQGGYNSNKACLEFFYDGQ
ncbi:Purple acid phosphatase, partial [Thalictrum thalictroides]